MTLAELPGKIIRTWINLHDQVEDLLTSGGFSARKYVCWRSLLSPFLRIAYPELENPDVFDKNLNKSVFGRPGINCLSDLSGETDSL